MEFIIRFMVNLFDLGIFRYYFHCFKQMKKVSKGLFAAYLVTLAAIWAAVSGLENPYLNLITLLSLLLLTTFFFVSKMWIRIVNIVIFVGTGILFEPIGLLLLQAANYTSEEDGAYKYYFVVALCSFIRGNVLYGNLLDNAIEACRKVPEGKRFIRLENKYQSGKLLLVITNSKTIEKNENLKTTKKDSYSHGRGILSVQRVADKYNGTAGFTDKGEVFEASVILYGIEVG